jgi:hypothetical protein
VHHQIASECTVHAGIRAMIIARFSRLAARSDQDRNRGVEKFLRRGKKGEQRAPHRRMALFGGDGVSEGGREGEGQWRWAICVPPCRS